ncbi:MAG: SMR family transporter [Nostoc sp. ChiSLP02]|nr:SMR family transporter [Nostoc sp. DedSLP05]MDZ8097880.1 SMR family transporter [Nostoc sp. DedSLP01]MDZ8183966.1 SMR family transporter [Nostoc sp. ChiSLP02]
MNYIPLILSGVFLNAFAQLFLKKGMLTIGYFDFSLANILPILFKVALNPFIILGLACYVISVGLWMLVLSRVEVSFAYPFLSVGYIITAIIGYTVFHENLSVNRLAGIFFICLGVIFISKR